MKDLNKITPNLSKIKKENPFRVPDQYFEELPGAIMERMKDAKYGQQRGYRLWTSFRPHLAIAATIIVFVIISYASVKLLFSDSTDQEFSSLEIAEYIEYYSSDLDEILFYEVLDDIQEQELNAADYEEVIINYLLDQDIDFQSIVEVL